jgi:hypothetical protein
MVGNCMMGRRGSLLALRTDSVRLIVGELQVSALGSAVLANRS